MLIITFKYLQDFKAFDFADSKLNCKMFGPVFSQIIICLIEIRTDGHIDGNGRPISSYSRGHERRENVKAESRPTDSITILPLFTLGK